MQGLEVVPGVKWVGSLDPELRVFDVIMQAPHGTTYNAYLVTGNDKAALVETVKEKFFPDFIDKLKKEIDISKIAYLILNHTEPDHAGSVAELLEAFPDLEIVASATAIRFLKAITNRNFKYREVQDGDTLDLGGLTLKFISAPFLHWPDSMFTYLPEKKVLFTCDAFGAHYSDERMFNDLVGDFSEDYRYYFDVLMAPFKAYVREALNKIDGLEIEVICPGHGPILRKDPAYYRDLYLKWAEEEVDPQKDLRVAVVYVSAYGYTASLAKAIIDGLTSVEGVEAKEVDIAKASVDEALAAARSSSGLIVGSPTIMGDALPPVWQFLTGLSPIVDQGKLAAAFGSYGWSGEAVPNIENRLRSLRMTVLPGLKVNFKPQESDLDQAYMFGYRFAQQLVERTKQPEERSWRCTVCLQVFKGAEPPSVCPACGASQDNFVKVEEEDIWYSSSEKLEIVIVGSGAAAVACAEAVRKRNQVCRVMLISEENHLPYYRPALSDLLSGDLPDAELYLHPKEWYEENNIELLLGRKVIQLDTEKQVIACDDGSTYHYDRLVLATGARSNTLPDLPGFTKQGVFTLRSLDDCLKLKEAVQTAQEVVVVGGGVLGLEAAWAFTEMGLKVTILENAPRLLPRQLDEAGSKILEEAVSASGVKVRRGAGVVEILGGEKVEGVRLADGEVLPCQIVLFSIGVTPNVDLAAQAGIKVNRGILVDRKMMTNAKNVLAAGDVAELEGAQGGLWPVALEQGKVAGANAVGDWQDYKPILPATYLVAFNLTVFAGGDPGQDPNLTYRTVEIRDPEENSYKKYYLVGGAMKGAVLIAPQVKAGGVLKALEAGRRPRGQAMRWKCLRCGYIHEGPEPPDFCPVCGAPKNMFVPVE